MRSEDRAPVIVMGMPPAWGLPSPSPFCLKLETWLRMAGVPYEARVVGTSIKSRSGKIPYVQRADGSTLDDSQFALETLAREWGVDLDAGLDPAERVQSHLLRRTLEEGLYFVHAHERWWDQRGFEATTLGYLGPLPRVIRSCVAWLLRRKMRRTLQGQGVSLYAPEQLAELGRRDVRALASALGDREFFFGRPSTIDAVAFGLLEQLRAFPVATPCRVAFEAEPNLVAFCERIRGRYWA